MLSNTVLPRKPDVGLTYKYTDPALRFVISLFFVSFGVSLLIKVDCLAYQLRIICTMLPFPIRNYGGMFVVKQLYDLLRTVSVSIWCWIGYRAFYELQKPVSSLLSS